MKILYKIKDRILKSEFNRNVLILAGGTAVAQAIPILISPILTRLYTPEDFGALAVFIAITSIVGVIVNGRYELAIMLPKKDEDAINVAAVAFLFNIFVSGLFFLFILFFGDWLLEVLNAQNLGKLIYLAPLAVFLIGVFNILNYTNNRFKLYKDISKANIYKSLAGSIVQVIMGFFKLGALGLISGQVVSQIVSNFKLFLNIKHLLRSIEKNKVKNMGIKYIKFPKYSMLSGLLNTLSTQLIPIFLSSLYTPKEAGAYYLAMRVLSTPMSFIGQAFSQVFFKEYAEKNNLSKNKAKMILLNTQRKLLLIAIIPFIVILTFGESIFVLVFGNEWELAGSIAKYLSPWLFLVFIYSPVSTVFDVLEKQKEAMYFQIIFLLSRISAIFFGFYIFIDFLETIELFAFVSFLLILWILAYINKNIGISLKLWLSAIINRKGVYNEKL